MKAWTGTAKERRMFALLRCCALAERFTSPTVPVKHTHATYLEVQRLGLAEWRNGLRLTESGKQWLDFRGYCIEDDLPRR